MQDGFVKAAAVTPDVRVADPVYNREQIVLGMREAASKGAKVIVFPELALTGYTCGDLFFQKYLLDRTYDELMEIVKASSDLDAVIFVGTPWSKAGRLYNCIAAVNRGELLGLVPKATLSDAGAACETRYFEPGNREPVYVDVTDDDGEEISVPFGANILFECEDFPELRIAAEICEDLWGPYPPGADHALAGAVLLVNASAESEAVGRAEVRRNLLAAQSRRLICGYVCAQAGPGESTTDLVFGGQSLIAANGRILAEKPRFTGGILTADIDIDLLTAERRKNTDFPPLPEEEYETVLFDLKVTETALEHPLPMFPFVPEDASERGDRCEEILQIQAMGLVKRLAHTGCRRAVIGLSGGLDSTLALLVAVKAFDVLGFPRKDICAITMPCFGTTDRTYQNACRMAQATGAELMEIPIREAVRVHFADIGQEENLHDVTYENAQARERTQVLMDVANQIGAMVIGTGDLSELALGWATYNGDHMSMYGVNGGVPKTLVRHLVRYYADTCEDLSLADTLRDVLDTPVSPELLPPQDGVISQKTEDLVGPYELHDYFLYYMLRCGFPPAKIFRLAAASFEGIYEPEVILKWLKVFFRRFFSQQFKRSCLPDGPKVGSVGVSPRGDLKMPSDACVRIWMDQLEHMESGGLYE